MVGLNLIGLSLQEEIRTQTKERPREDNREKIAKEICSFQSCENI